MKKHILFLSMMCFCCIHGTELFAQQVPAVAGGDASGTGGSASYSVGEATYEHFSSSNGNIKEGVQQPEIYVILSVKVLLSGPFDATAGLMKDDLRADSMIPVTEPYSVAPFNKPGIAENSGETVNTSILNVSGPNAIVDWVYLELRAANNSALITATKRALLQRDGDVVSPIDGSSALLFTHIPIGSYYITVKHRNHLGVMTANAVALTGGEVIVDFTSMAAVYTKPGLINTPRRNEGGVFTLWPGDANYNKNVKYNGILHDRSAILAALGGNVNNVIYHVYRVEDVNMDTNIRYNGLDNDRMVILNALGVQSPNSIINQHTPD